MAVRVRVPQGLSLEDIAGNILFFMNIKTPRVGDVPNVGVDNQTVSRIFASLYQDIQQVYPEAIISRHEHLGLTLEIMNIIDNMDEDNRNNVINAVVEESMRRGLLRDLQRELREEEVLRRYRIGGNSNCAKRKRITTKRL
jgi:hypothetical protein